MVKYMSDNDCVFCSIANDKKKKIFEDETCFVVFDLYPSEYGHTLVISKSHTESVLTSTDEDISHMFVVSKMVATKIKERLGASGINIATNVGKDAGQIIPHFHIHIIPRYPGGQRQAPHKQLDDATRDELLKKIGN